MARKPRTLEELEREMDKAVDAELARPPTRRRAQKQQSVRDVERYDHIFSPDEAQSVKGCLQNLASDRGRLAGSLVSARWRDILIEAKAYEQRLIPMRKERIGRAIKRLSQQYGPDSLAVRIVRGQRSPRGRPAGGKGNRDAYIAVVCAVYERVSGRRLTFRWDRRAKCWRGASLELLRACLAPHLFFEKDRPLKDDAIVQAVRRIAEREQRPTRTT